MFRPAWQLGAAREDAGVPDDPAAPPSLINREAGRVLVVDEDGALLLLRGTDPARPEAGSWWFTPGGGLDDGETVEAAARRELREETGLAVTELGPVVFRRTVDFSFEGVDYRQSEQFFCVRSPRFAIDDAGWTDVERRIFLEQRWWTYAELVATDEIIHPAELAQILRGVLAGSGQDVI
jgi:8-oxo-dGTP pyrophosphatase MutT (NUDIX family)